MNDSLTCLLQSDWGRADATQQAEFKGEVDRFVSDLEDALASLGGGLELSKPNRSVLNV